MYVINIRSDLKEIFHAAGGCYIFLDLFELDSCSEPDKTVTHTFTNKNPLEFS